MSMFDYVFCEYPLPLPEEAKDLKDCNGFKKGVVTPVDWSNFEFQTKDFGGFLEKYTIEEDGQVYKESIERELVEHENGDVEMIEKDNGIEKVEHTGEITFYGIHLDEKYDYWIEVKALFWKGDLKEVDLLKWEKQDNTKRIEDGKKFKEKVMGVIKREKKAIFKIKSAYNLVVRYIFGFFIKFCWFLQRIFTFKN